MLAAGAIAFAAVSQAAANELLFVSTGDATRPPIGWVEFCAERPLECKVSATAPRDVVLSNKAWTDLVRINKWVNENVKPMTDSSTGVWSRNGRTRTTVTATAKITCS
jgi:predicted transglutaminase-like cysteine proteinase